MATSAVSRVLCRARRNGCCGARTPLARAHAPTQGPHLDRVDVGMFFPNDITHLRFTRSSRRRSITRVQKDGVSYKRKSARLTEEREP